jgi:septal ring-binding cell division protein DamX
MVLGALKVGGTAKLLLGFIVGALVTLGTLRYVSSMRDVALADGDRADGTPASAERPRSSRTHSPQNPVAFQLSYELSRVPAAELPVSTERILNARPINPLPPEPGDRTREIQKEAQNPAYREPPRPASAPVGKVFEGREVQIKPRPPQARPRAPEQASEPKAPEPAASSARPPATGATGSAPQTESLTVTDRDKEAALPPAPKPADTPAPGAKSAPADAVESRVRLTREWLGSAAQTTHTIQLLGTPSEAQLKTHLLVLSKLLEPGKLYVFRTVAQGKPSITVVYGEYADRKAALQALDELPSPAAAYRPVLRTVNGIRAELKQHGLE